MIRSKSQMYELFNAGRFGNRTANYDSVEAALSDTSCRIETFVFRCKVPGGPCWYDIPRDKLASEYERYVAELRRRKFPVKVNISEKMPDHLVTLQGELAELPGGLVLKSSTLKAHMRTAMADEATVSHDVGLAAKMKLRRHMDATSLDWLRDLLDDFPSHVIEFACFSQPVGLLQTNTIVWEVRFGY